MRWFWANHAVHHSPNDLNLSAAIRIDVLGKLTGTALFFVPLVWIGFDPRIVFATLTMNLLYQFWMHATWIPKLGWLEGIINTPSANCVPGREYLTCRLRRHVRPSRREYSSVRFPDLVSLRRRTWRYGLASALGGLC